jgi:Arc/MetJ-type ribon-helix-helix transcriptional regulator
LTRLTVTLDERTTGELHELRVAELRGLLLEMMNSPSATEERAQTWSRLVRSMDRLGDDPSASAVIRQALDYYLAALKDAQMETRLETGYALLASDDERREMIETTSKRAPARWTDEP